MDRERTQEELRDTCDKACEILKKTNDGDDLDPSDLKLTELAVNGYLNDAGREVFEKLYQRVVIDENYVKPYLHNIEHITRDHEGYIYYKGTHIEHYDSDYVYSEAAKNELTELKRRCEFLERKGVEVSCGNAVWRWEEFADEYGAERLKEMDALLGNQTQGFQYSRIELYNSGREFIFYVCGKPENLEEIKNHPVTQGMIGRYFDDEFEIIVKSFIYGKRQAHTLIPLNMIVNKADIESLLASCHNYLRSQDKLMILPEITHKTDFAEGYENVERLDSLLSSPGRSLLYSEVFMYGYLSEQSKHYVCGIPTFDEIKQYFEYESLLAHYGEKLNVSVTTYQYGSGEPLTAEEIPRAAEIEELLHEAHPYLQKTDLSEETGWKDYTRGLEVNRAANRTAQTEPDYEVEDGYEP